ncbi:MAG: glycosyltransferase [Chloroflexi bacterium]|nr:glycosyltransferase [Chloroflexota bacterium]
MRIAWGYTATPDQPHGYSVIAKMLPEALNDAGATWIAGWEFDWDVRVIISQPVSWVAGRNSSEDVVWHTMYEAWPLVPGWAGVLNRVRAVWAPSQWVKWLFEDAGVTVPIGVCGYGVDHEAFYPVQRTTDGPMRFLAWARGLVSRKNVLGAIRAFLAAEPIDAVLEVKLNLDDTLAPSGVTFDGVEEGRITIIQEDWPRHKLADWLRSGDSLIYLSGGEGFGLMPLEAMATGCSVICSYNTGMMDFLTEDNAMLVHPTGRAPAKGYTERFGYECWIEQPDFDQAVEWIRWASENREAALAIGQRGQGAASQWTWQRAGERAFAMLGGMIR